MSEIRGGKKNTGAGHKKDVDHAAIGEGLGQSAHLRHGHHERAEVPGEEGPLANKKSRGRLSRIIDYLRKPA